MERKTVAVLGGGFQGCCLALELSARGFPVHLYEQDEDLLQRTGVRNEGKIHLGYVYANSDFETAELMLRGARVFFGRLSRWLALSPDRIPVSDPFNYLVHRETMVPAEAVFAHARRIADVIDRGPAFNGYPLGGVPAGVQTVPLTSDELDRHYAVDHIPFVFKTVERAVDVPWVASRLREAVIAEPGIEVRLQTRVVAAQAQAFATNVHFDTREGRRANQSYRFVINAAWEGRIAIDRTMNLTPSRPWLWRFKRGVRVRWPEADPRPPSFTVALGPFGDFVGYEDSSCYLSWYPHDLESIGGEDEPQRMAPVLARAPALERANATIDALADLAPGLSALRATLEDSVSAEGGNIYAFAETDIVDQKSGLHAREGCGIQHVTDSYLSLDPGKYTLAPFYAGQAADAVEAIVTQ